MFKFSAAQEKWLSMLETTDFPQTDGCLVQTDGDKPTGFCCLGIGAMTLGLEIDITEGRFFTGHTDDFGNPIFICDLLAIGIYKELNLRNDCGSFAKPYIDGVAKYVSLVAMNDSGNFSFKDIARYIRENPENVFAS